VCVCVCVCVCGQEEEIRNNIIIQNSGSVSFS